MSLLAQQLRIGEALKSAAHQDPKKVAFVHQDEQVTYQELLQRSYHLAGWLQEHGIRRDDKVGYLFKNGMRFVEIYFGVSMTGGVNVPINFRLGPNEMTYIINHADIKILIVDQEYVEVIQSIRSELPQVEMFIVASSQQDLSAIDMLPYDSIYDTPVCYQEDEQLSDEDAHMIIYTSGTTGRPKGAVLTHKNIMMNALIRLSQIRRDTNSRVLVVAPLFHLAALSSLIYNCLQPGTAYIHRDFQPVDILETIQNEKINGMMLVPSMWNFLFQVPNLLGYDLRSMLRCTTGGAICPLELKKRILEVFPNGEIFESFGQTEMSPSTTSLLPEDALRKIASVGKPVMTLRVRVVDDAMNDVPVGEVGEIIYQGPTMLKEYYKQPEATAEAMRGGWFHSGDLVRMDEEGFVYIVDRKKDMIISGGENIYPAEIEEVLYTHPDILEAAVIGIPDPEWGESVKACVVLKPGRMLTQEQVIEYIRNSLASYKKPRFVEFLEALPRNAAGKVLKTILREQQKEQRAKDAI